MAAAVIVAAIFFGVSYAAAAPDEKLVRVTILYREPENDIAVNGISQKFRQQDTSGELEKNGGIIRHRFSGMNAVSADVPESLLGKIESDPRVAAVESPVDIYAQLIQSVPLINADRSWRIRVNGKNITGRGTSICVIDTGIDYNHTDFGGAWGKKVIAGYNAITSEDCSLNNSACFDDHGHGTHVAGIIAANGSIKGVAPDASLVAIKVLDASGSGTSDDVDKAIDWCINQSAKYNITAISMSLGDRNSYPAFCDTGYNFTSTGMMTDAAVAKNISVIVASGNSGSAFGVSYPACIRNATRVTATDKSDNYAAFAQRSAGFPDILAAPGIGICSSKASLASSGAPCYDSSHISLDGTSMAAPHVSGTVALISQAYLIEYGALPDPLLLRARMRETGKKIPDGKTGAVFSRIDALSAADSFIPPDFIAIYNNITGDGSAAISVNSTDSVFFSVSSDRQPSFFWYLDGALQRIGGANFSWQAAGNDSDKLALVVIASNGYRNSSFRWNITIRNSTIGKSPPASSTDSPADNVWSAANNIAFACSATGDSPLSNISLYGNWSGNWVPEGTNSVSGARNSTSFSITIPDGIWRWNCLASDSSGISAFADANRTIRVDGTAPSDLAYAAPASPYLSQNWYFVNLTFREANPEACILSENGVRINMTAGKTGCHRNMTDRSDGNYTYNITVYDSAGNSNTSATRKAMLDTIAPSVVLLHPENTTYNSVNRTLDYTVYDSMSGIGAVWYSYDGSNTTVARNTTFTAVSDNRSVLVLYARDLAGNTNSASVVFSTDTINPQVSLLSARGTGMRRSNWLSANASAKDANFANLTVYLYNSSGEINASVSYSPEAFVNFTGLADGTYYLSAAAYDSAGNQNITGRTSWIFSSADTEQDMAISILSPLNGTILPAGTASVLVSIATDRNASCRYSSNSSFDYSGGSVFSSTGNTSHSFQYSGLSDSQSYRLFYKCNSTSGYISGPATFHAFSVGSPAVVATNNPGGSGGGSPLGTYAPKTQAACVPEWTCSRWSLCASGTQTRSCSDTKKCGSNIGRPTLKQNCGAPVSANPKKTDNSSSETSMKNAEASQPAQQPEPTGLFLSGAAKPGGTSVIVLLTTVAIILCAKKFLGPGGRFAKPGKFRYKYKPRSGMR